jgi:hypothetical protein
MCKKAFIFCLFLALLTLPNLYSQYDKINSSSTAPWAFNKGKITDLFLPNPSTIGYAYYLTQSNENQLFRFNVGTPGSATLIGSPQSPTMGLILGNGDFANPTGVWKFYVQSHINPPYTIYEVDTATGNLDSICVPLNLRSGHKPRDIEWDHTTNTMFIISTNTNNTETQFYSMDWQTGILTWIGPLVTSPAAITAGGFNANGTYFGCDMATGALWKVNKYTGAWTQVGPLGIPVCLWMDAGFDRSDFSKMLLCSCTGIRGLYQVDTASGSATLIGSFPSEYDPNVIGFMPVPGPQIIHTPLQNTQNVTGPYVVNAAVIPSGAGIATTKLYWSRNNPTVTDSVTMTHTSGNNWTGNIPGNGLAATYRYYLWTKDSLNKSVAAPYTAPVNLYSFIANANDTIKPVIVHTPLGNILKYQWPDSILASVTDNIGIDSVWVRWRINSNATKQIKLFNPTGSIYNAVFNSLNSDVNEGDTIYYRIIAQDNSFNHNRDSTGLIGFVIVPSFYTCIGNGTATIGSGSPFFTFWRGNKTQMLWTASEISENGGTLGNILKIGFYAVTVDTQRMNNFNIKMQSTSLTSLTNGFISSGWLTMYSGTFAVTGPGWQFITLQTPFYWDGESNILIDVCFNNTTYSVGSLVMGTTVPSMEYYAGHYNDTLACTSYENPYGSSERPNVCFNLVPISGTVNNTNNPTMYKLSQNYPNPFNPVTKIKYDIPRKGFVSLKIYDILGRVVKELVNEIKSQGSYVIDYNASGLSSGVYLYRLECNGYIETKRMILLK